MIGSAGNVVRQVEVDSFVLVAVIRDAEKYVCNRCEAASGFPHRTSALVRKQSAAGAGVVA